MSKGLKEATIKIIDEMFYDSEKINFYTVSKKADVSRAFLYQNKEIVDKIDYYKKFNSLSIDERIDFLKDENSKIEKRLQTYEKLLMDKLIATLGE